MNLELEIEAAKKLNKEKNWHKEKYLSQFNYAIRTQLERELRDLPLSNRVIVKDKYFTTKCVECKSNYRSTGACDDLGICDSCSLTHSKKMEKITADGTTLWIKTAYSQKVLQTNFPFWLGEEKIQNIMEFFYDNFYKKRNFRLKIDALPTINRKFGTQLTKEQFLPMTPRPVMRRRGFNFDLI
jgi:hypothetical protein